MKEKIRQWIETVSLELILTISSLLVCVWLLYLVIPLALQAPLNRFDGAIITYFNTRRTPTLVHWMVFISFLGSTMFLLPAYLFCIAWLIRTKQQANALAFAVIGISSTLVMFLLKQVFERHRPASPAIVGVDGYSFPSGHALSGFIFCTLVAELIYRQQWRTGAKLLGIGLLALVSLSIALSRVALNVHYATDVIGGLCIGFIWVVICFSIFRKFRLIKNASL